MNDAHYTPLTDRAILSVSGADSLAFLQGIVTNDMEKVSSTKAIYAAILTPQGKYLHDFFVTKAKDRYLIDCPISQTAELTKRLKMYRLRADVEIDDQSEQHRVLSIVNHDDLNEFGLDAIPGKANLFGGGIVFIDPRLAELGIRAIIPAASSAEFEEKTELAEQPLENYKFLQHSVGVPDGNDGEVLKQAFPLEMGFDELNAISFDKGCYVGQEVTTRMKIRNLVKKRLVPIHFEDGSPEAGADVLDQNKTTGQVFSVGPNSGLAMIRLEAIEQVAAGESNLIADEIPLQATQPDWFQLPG